jgi:hypothetical protein
MIPRQPGRGGRTVHRRVRTAGTAPERPAGGAPAGTSAIRQRRDLIYTLPQQFGSLKQVADRFLKEVFRPSRYEERVLLRGRVLHQRYPGRHADRSADEFAGHHVRLAPQTSQHLLRQGPQLLHHPTAARGHLSGSRDRRRQPAVERWRAWIQRGAYAGALLITASGRPAVADQLRPQRNVRAGGGKTTGGSE